MYIGMVIVHILLLRAFKTCKLIVSDWSSVNDSDLGVILCKVVTLLKVSLAIFAHFKLMDL